MATGTDWMITALANFAGIKPEELKANLANSAQIIVGLKAQLDRMEARLIRIENTLTPETQNVESIGPDQQIGIGRYIGLQSGEPETPHP